MKGSYKIPDKPSYFGHIGLNESIAIEARYRIAMREYLEGKRKEKPIREKSRVYKTKGVSHDYLFE